MGNHIDVKFQSSVIELSRPALQENIRFLKKVAGASVTLCSVIKGNAYGHGISTFLPMAERCGVTHFAVFSADEAEIALRARNRPETEIMIMGMIHNDALEWAIRNDISFYVFEKDRLQAAAEAARACGKKARIHLEIETGMNRIGFEEALFDDTIRFILDNGDHLKVEGICTHFAGAESVKNYERITRQNQRFKGAVDRFKTELPTIPYVHAASSAALLTYPETLYNLVRVGISQFGFWPSREVYMYLQKSIWKQEERLLSPVMRWKSWVMSVKSVKADSYVGYGTMYQTKRDEKIATIPIGYTHGFGRNLTNIGYVLIDGKRAPVVGIVNMNMITVEVTDIEGVQKGDEVVIIGKQKEEEITVASFSELSNDLNYEVLARLPANLPRLVSENHF